MRPKRIILVRHGESEGNADRYNYETIPDYALNLTCHGESQAINAGKEIAAVIGNESVFAYISPYYRTRQTFACMQTVIGSNVKKAIEDPRIRELDWGHLRHPDDNENIIRERNNYGLFYYRIKDGQSGADVYDRVSTFLETMHRDFSKDDYPENAVIVTHGMTLRIFLMRWLHWSVEEFEILKNPWNCKVVVLEQNSDGKYQLITEMEKRG
jgi:broad specificity phosphatase PhoE